MDELKEIRQRIDGIDAQIAALFEQRMQASRDVVEYKMKRGMAVCDPVREAELVRKNSELVGDDTVREYYVNFEKNLMALSRRFQERVMNGLKVAYAGVPGAFSATAAAKMFPGAELVPCMDFEQAYSSCSSGETDVAVLPLENSSAGEVGAVTDLLFSGDLFVNQVLEIEAVQNLLGCEGATPESVREVVSHQQALSQCAAYIHDHKYLTHEFPNTALAAQMVAERRDPSVAAIASAECAGLYGLRVIERNINTSGVNTTRFGAFSRVLSSDAGKRRMGRHFILTFTARNEAGSLAKVLNIIGAHGYNMCSLRSRPMNDLKWNYYFYIELDGNVYTEEGRSMINELGTLCERFKLAGSF